VNIGETEEELEVEKPHKEKTYPQRKEERVPEPEPTPASR